MIGGEHQIKSKEQRFCHIHTLSLKSEDVNSDEWKWRNVTKTEIGRQHASCLVIGDNDEKLMLIAGHQHRGKPNSTTTTGRPAMKRSECYNFELDEWMSLKNARFPRQKSGVWYDRSKENIYLIGGEDGYGYSSNKCESYDVAKNIWNRLPSTNGKHGQFPVVWNEIGKNLLCVASMTANCIECIDLRDSTQKWNILKKGTQEWKLIDLFHSCVAYPRQHRMLKFL